MRSDPSDPLKYFREATWDEALDFAANGLKKVIRETEGSGLAGFGSAKGSNEEAYLFQKLVRTGFQTNNVDLHTSVPRLVCGRAYRDCQFRSGFCTVQ